MLQVNRKFAWRPEIADHRDKPFSLKTTVSLPAFVTPLGIANLIEDQGDLGSCVGVASTSSLEIVTKSVQLSKLMAYYNARAIEGTVQEDSGSYIRDAMKAFKNNGCCAESLWPYNVSKFATRPSSTCYTDAKKIIPLVSRYERITTLGQVKTALAAGLPVTFGFMVPNYFVNDYVASTGWLRMPTVNDSIIGGHAVTAVGYETRPAVVKGIKVPFIWVRNSWGKSWGQNGYFMMDQRWFSDPRRLVDDMWVIYPK